MKPRRIGFLIPEFPQQTHIAWWRVSEEMVAAGTNVLLLSTRRPNDVCPHPQLERAAEATVYIWPPAWIDISAAPSAVSNTLKIARYLISLDSRRGLQRIRALALVIAATRLLRISRSYRLDHLFVHSCADAAHVAAICKMLGGPPYSLRLGGDLEVYGGDHRAKMAEATLIVSAAKSYEERLVNEVGLSRQRIMWSWVGTDTDHFHPDGSQPEGETLRIITVARLNRAKGFQYMIPALALLRESVDFRYRIVGAGPFESEIRALVSNWDLNRNVEFLGARSATDVASLLQESDLFVLPTSGIGEGTPAAVCEAMSTGIPVVATNVGGLADMIVDGSNGYLVPPSDVPALAMAISRIAMDRPLGTRMGAAGRAKAVEQYDVGAIAKSILAKIDELTG